jgi:DNA-binding MarR family transcriptional regulator
MSTHDDLTLRITHEVRDHCLCLATQRAARALARHFDDAFRPLQLTSGQFSLLMSLNRPDPPAVGELAALLAMDRTTITANVKPLERRRLLRIVVDKDDRRSRRLQLTDAGRELLVAAIAIWRKQNRALERTLSQDGAARLRAQLAGLG